MSEKINQNSFENPVVFVLGAGFTKAFDDDAPLMWCDINFNKIKEKFERSKFPEIAKFLESVEVNKEGKVNVEVLLTRLYTGSPYDFVAFKPGEREILFHEVKNRFENRLRKIKPLNELSGKSLELIKNFSAYIIENDTSVITFNYDYLLDEALYKHFPVVVGKPTVKYWHPDGGYGFFCRPSRTLIDDSLQSFKDSAPTLLLKLHGSLNWRIKKGTHSKYPLESLVHHEPWHSLTSIATASSIQDVDRHIENDSFIIPPVLDKTTLNYEPVLRLVWESAYDKLSKAKTIIFMGYSLPFTDIATRFLFNEAQDRSTTPKIIVVNKSKNKKDEFESRYKEIFSNCNFSYSGVLEWIEKNIKPLISPPPPTLPLTPE